MTDNGSPTPILGSAARGGGRRVALSASLARATLLTVALLAAVTFLIALPMLALLQTALEDGLAALASAVASAAPAIAASLWTSLGATVVAVAVGASLAFLTERTSVSGRRGLRLAMLVAFIVPGYVAAVGWLNAYGPGGVLDDLLGLAVPSLVGPLGIIVVLGIEAAPIAYLITAAGFATRAEPDLERAARASGADAWTAFRSVTLPLLRPVLAGAAAIAFVLSVTSFGVPAVLGVPAGFTTMTTRIYRDLAFSSDPDSFVRAMGLAIVLAVGAALVIALGDVLLERRRTERSGVFDGPLGDPRLVVQGPVADGGRRRRSAPTLALGVAAWLLVILAIVVPLVALVLTALTRAPGLDPMPTNWTLEHFREVLGPRTLGALLNSTLLAGLAAIGVVILGLLAVAARRGQGAGPIGGVLGLTFALPGSTLAVAILLAYGVALRDTLLIILVAYLAKFWALGYRPVASGLEGMAVDLYRAARVSGADGPTTTRTIVLPLLRPLIVAGGLIVFVFGLHEVTMSSLLYGPGTSTLAVVVLNLQQLGEAGQTAALAIVLTGIVALASLPLLHWRGSLEGAGWRR